MFSIDDMLTDKNLSFHMHISLRIAIIFSANLIILKIDNLIILKHIIY